MAEADLAGKAFELDLLEGLGDQAVGLVQVETVVEGDDARRVLPAVLDGRQAFEQRAGDVVMSDDA